MTDRLNAEGHDESQYLPKNVPIVNAFRERRGGVRYEGTAIKAVEWLPDILFDREDEREKPYNDTCVSVYGYHINTLHSLGMRATNNILFDPVFAVTQLPAVDTYAAIIHGLAKPESIVLLWTVCTERNHGNIGLARSFIGTIRHAIENAQSIIDALTEKRKRTLEQTNQEK